MVRNLDALVGNKLATTELLGRNVITDGDSVTINEL